jgi:hypothetical protein
MPCLVHDVTDPAQLDGGAIDIARLAGDNPPAMAHFTQGLALPVRLRAVSRVIEVGWRQYLRYDE